MTDRTFSMAEIARLVPELGRWHYTRSARNTQYLSDVARSVRGSGNYRRYTAVDIAVLRALCDLDGIIDTGQARSAVLLAIHQEAAVSVRVGAFEITYQPRWLTEAQIEALDRELVSA